MCVQYIYNLFFLIMTQLQQRRSSLFSPSMLCVLTQQIGLISFDLSFHYYKQTTLNCFNQMGVSIWFAREGNSIFSLSESECF